MVTWVAETCRTHTIFIIYFDIRIRICLFWLPYLIYNDHWVLNIPMSYIFVQSSETKIAPVDLWCSRSILKLKTDDFIRECRELLVWDINNVANKLNVDKLSWTGMYVIFKSVWPTSNTLCARKLTWSAIPSRYPQALGATVRNFIRHGDMASGIYSPLVMTNLQIYK